MSTVVKFTIDILDIDIPLVYCCLSLSFVILDAINKASSAWGITCLRYEIRDIKMPDRVSKAMQLQVEAERNKRAQVLESEGTLVYIFT